MNNRKMKRIIASLAAVTMLAGAVCAPVNVFAGEMLGNFDFEKGVGNPWTLLENGPAYASFNISDGWYNIDIYNPGGKSRGGEDRWDLQLIHSKLNMNAEHTYTVKYTVKADSDGYLWSYIGSTDGADVLWNGNGNVAIEGGSKDNKQGEIKYEEGWTLLKVTAGEEMTFTAEFKPKESMKNAVWAFQFGGDGEYGNGSGEDCFPVGTRLSFKDFSLIDMDEEDAGETKDTAYKYKDISANQLGYLTNGIKQATYAPSNGESGIYRETKEGTDEITFSLMKGGKEVYTGKASMVNDKDSGNYAYVLDFSEYKEAGSDYTIKVGTNESSTFSIGEGKDIYKGLYEDAVNYFYLNRSGIAVEKEYVSAVNYDNQIESAKKQNVDGTYISKDNLARKAGFTKESAYIQEGWVDAYSADGSDVYKKNIQEISGGWYDGCDYGKSVAENGTAVWTLLNIYENALSEGNEKKYEDGSLLIPENTNKAPDILDEVKWEMDFFRKMICKDGDCKDMLYTSANGFKWTGLAVSPVQETAIAEGTDPKKDTVYRIIRPVSTGATLEFAATAAQFARLYKEYDEEYSSELLKEAENAYKAAAANDDIGGEPVNTHGTAYSLTDFEDEYYWAACELYLSTGNESYLSDMKANKHYLNVSDSVTSDTASLGSISLLANAAGKNKNCTGKVDSEMADTIKKNLTNAADSLYDLEEKQAYGVPFESNEENCYPEYSNAYIMNNGIIFGLAYKYTGTQKYLDGAQRTMDYILGRNPNEISYVTGYGSNHTTFVHNPNWAAQIDADNYTLAPSGVLSCGPNSDLSDYYIAAAGFSSGDTAPQKCYADNMESWSTNETNITLNASLAWMADFMTGVSAEEKEAIEVKENTSADRNTASEANKLVYGDLNGDGVADLTDLTSLSVYLMDKSTASSLKNVAAGDVDANGIIDIADLARFKQYICHDASVAKLGPTE